MYDNYNIKPSCIMLPKTSIYVENYDGKLNGYIFLIEDDKLLTLIWVGFLLIRFAFGCRVKLPNSLSKTCWNYSRNLKISSN